MGGVAVGDPDELDAIEIALDDDPDELDEDSTLVFGLKGDDCPLNRERRGREHVGSGLFMAGEIVIKRFTHPKQRECECPSLEPDPKRRPSPRRAV